MSKGKKKSSSNASTYYIHETLPRPLWAVLLILDAAIFFLGAFTGRIDLIVMAFVMTLLLDILGRRGLLRGYGDEVEADGHVLKLTGEQRTELISELRAQRKSHALWRKKGDKKT